MSRQENKKRVDAHHLPACWFVSSSFSQSPRSWWVKNRSVNMCSDDYRMIIHVSWRRNSTWCFQQGPRTSSSPASPIFLLQWAARQRGKAPGWDDLWHRTQLSEDLLQSELLLYWSNQTTTVEIVLQRSIYVVILCLCFWKIALKELRTLCFVFLSIEGLRWSAVLGKGSFVLIDMSTWSKYSILKKLVVSVVISKQGSHIH